MRDLRNTFPRARSWSKGGAKSSTCQCHAEFILSSESQKSGLLNRESANPFSRKSHVPFL